MAVHEKAKALNFQGLFIRTEISGVIIGGAERDRTVDLRVANAIFHKKDISLSVM